MTLSVAGGNSITFDGMQFDPVTHARIDLNASQVEDINPNNIGFGVGNGNLEDNEGFVSTVINPVDGMQFTVIGQAGSVDTTTIYWTAYGVDGADADLDPDIVDSGSITLTGLKSVDPEQVVTILSDYEFTSIEVRFDMPGSNDAVRIQDFSIIDKIVPSELDLEFTATATDGDGDVVSADFVVHIDSAPDAQDDNAYVSEGQSGDTNLMLIIDVSGSMNDTVTYNGSSMSRLAATKLATIDLLNKYSDASDDVMVRLVQFSGDDDDTNSGDAKALESTWVDVAKAIDLVNGLNAGNASGTGSWTNYDAALAVAQTAYASSGKLANAQSVSYFLSDGAPTIGSGGVGISGSEEAAWKNFLNANDIVSYAIGVGSGAVQSALNPVAWDGSVEPSGSELNGLLVTNESQLSSVLETTVIVPSMAGNVLNNDASGSDGWDNPALLSIEYNGVEYSFASAAASHVINLGTAIGSVTVYGNGNYVFQPVYSDVNSPSIAELVYTVSDSDGSLDTATLRLGLTDRSEVHAYDNYDQAVVRLEPANNSVNLMANQFMTDSNGGSGVVASSSTFVVGAQPSVVSFNVDLDLSPSGNQFQAGFDEFLWQIVNTADSSVVQSGTVSSDQNVVTASLNSGSYQLRFVLTDNTSTKTAAVNVREGLK